VPLGLQNGNGVLTLTKDRLEVTDFRGTVGGGNSDRKREFLYRRRCDSMLDYRGKAFACFTLMAFAKSWTKTYLIGLLIPQNWAGR